jgi:hypothetical protein
VSDPIADLRAATAAVPPPPAAMASYLQDVRQRAYAVDDGTMAALRDEFTDDTIFEQTVAAAVDEGLRRLEAAERVIGA